MVYRNFREDIKTHKKYTLTNIPIGRLCGVRLNQTHKFRIFSMSNWNGVDRWYNGEFMGDEYAVFSWIEQAHCWQQVSPWYVKFGNALNFMLHKCVGSDSNLWEEAFTYDSYEPM